MILSAPSPWRWQRHGELASTQDAAIQAARSGAPGRLAVIADCQSAGRGSRGRAWVAPEGNLNLSLLLRPANARPDPGYWAMLAGVALYEALAPFATGLVLKWPNDLLCQGGKLGGMLIESALDNAGCVDWLVIGIGANLTHAPRLADRSTACLGAGAPAAADVARHLVDALDACADWDVRAAWLARAHRPGTPLRVQTAHGWVTAPFAGLGPRGELLLDGVCASITSAEVAFEHQRAPCFSS